MPIVIVCPHGAHLKSKNAFSDRVTMVPHARAHRVGARWPRAREAFPRTGWPQNGQARGSRGIDAVPRDETAKSPDRNPDDPWAPQHDAPSVRVTVNAAAGTPRQYQSAL